SEERHEGLGRLRRLPRLPERRPPRHPPPRRVGGPVRPQLPQQGRRRDLRSGVRRGLSLCMESQGPHHGPWPRRSACPMREYRRDPTPRSARTMSQPPLRLNPALDVQKYADVYARDGLVQIPDVFEKPTAELISEIMETSLPWSLSSSGEDGRPVKIPMEALQGAAGDLREQVAALIQRSGKQYGFIYFNF